MRLWLGLGLILAACAAAGLWLTAPTTLDDAAFAEREGDPIRGERIFNAGGCASCHKAPGAEEDARLVLAGGVRFETEFGTFVAPNISPGPEGIGGWSALDLANAMIHGVSPDGAHYFPVFPYDSYRRASRDDIVDLKAYIDTLPVSSAPSAPHELSFPFSIRRGVGLWKLLYLSPDWVLQEAETDQIARGRELVEGLGHCSACHTPRTLFGGPDAGQWLAGGPNPDGRGRIPNITPHESALGGWSEIDIVTYLTIGLRPDYDAAGGSMVDVIDNLKRLPEDDITAIAAYLQAIPARAK